MCLTADDFSLPTVFNDHASLPFFLAVVHVVFHFELQYPACVTSRTHYACCLFSPKIALCYLDALSVINV